jgi:hypothetical protein
MKLKFTLTRPATLIEGSEYLMKESTEADQVPTLVPVKFVAYEPHCAFVIISRGEDRQRCSRDNLFVMENGDNE